MVGPMAKLWDLPSAAQLESYQKTEKKAPDNNSPIYLLSSRIIADSLMIYKTVNNETSSWEGT